MSVDTLVTQDRLRSVNNDMVSSKCHSSPLDDVNTTISRQLVLPLHRRTIQPLEQQGPEKMPRQMRVGLRLARRQGWLQSAVQEMTTSLLNPKNELHLSGNDIKRLRPLLSPLIQGVLTWVTPQVRNRHPRVRHLYAQRAPRPFSLQTRKLILLSITRLCQKQTNRRVACLVHAPRCLPLFQI